ncbi:Dimeric dUTPase [Aequoribacter fuscus]|uniref:Dimeric dUTPase n=1 Tax=Aequoribacter fuscus TaxID=2518989 RepID=F3L1Y8_9GAMM|nr:dUTP diphosphatase [Aequoribacter fuscus]EGG29666.1 Dimeric dUTPase [Aequoribacter fuscus]QHJ87969.1 dUTP diphosphatase [Aequoribacter fuscus]
MTPAILTMLRLQDQMNQKVHPDWVSQNYEWYRAVWIECAELMDHVGYKWWKHQECDMDQVQLEVIDIWHFGLSAMFDTAKDFEMMASQIVEAISTHDPVDMDIRTATESLAQHCLQTGGFSVTLFWNLLTAAELDFDALYRSYVGKNVLNFFRQDNGYKEGTYIKQWAGREDNEHLVELVADLDTGAEDFADRLYQALVQRYASCID